MATPKKDPKDLLKEGRKSLYRKKYIKMMLEFFSIEPTRQVPSKVFIDKKGVMTTEYVEKPNRLPTFERFASEIGVSVDTLLEWSKAKNKQDKLKYPEFSGAYSKCKQLQKDFLIANGTSGLFNPTFTIFVAKNITDMRDKVETDVTSGGEPVKITGFNYIVPKDRIDDPDTPTIS